MIKELIVRKGINFYPFGMESKLKCVEWYEKCYQLLYSIRAYVHWTVGDGFEEGEISEGYTKGVK